MSEKEEIDVNYFDGLEVEVYKFRGEWYVEASNVIYGPYKTRMQAYVKLNDFCGKKS